MAKQKITALRKANDNNSASYKGLLHKCGLFEDLMEYAPDVIYFKDKKGRLIMVNQAHARGLGLKPQEVIGKTDFDFFSKERAKKMFEDDMRIMKTGRPLIDKIERATRPDGVDNYVSTTKIPRYDDKGNIIGLMGITRDITKRMQLERLQKEKAVIEKKLESSQELNQLKTDFISVVSHELRTPLTLIKEGVLLVTDEIAGAINDKQKEVLLKTRHNIERLNKLIDELLDVSRIEARRMKLNYSLINLNDFLKDFVYFFAKMSEDRGIRLECSLPGAPINVFMDAERIHQVASNLMNNSLKFTEEGGLIRIEVTLLENKIRMAVIDTGIGIHAEDLTRLFNKFVQASRNTEAQRKGMGLGLFIAKELVERHGGEIWAESKPGVGSRFYFTLPRFYTPAVLNSEVCGRINGFLSKGSPVFLISVQIVNYSDFKRKGRALALSIGTDLKDIVDEAMVNSSQGAKGKAELISSDIKNGGYLILTQDEAVAVKVSSLLKEAIRSLLLNKGINDIFINLANNSYPLREGKIGSREFMADLNIKKVSIGYEVRRFKRVRYQVEVEIALGEDKAERACPVDISLGGICFLSSTAFETDSIIGLKLMFKSRLPVIHARGRVAWRKDAASLKAAKGLNNRYKVGLEFIGLGPKDRNYLSRVIRLAPVVLVAGD